MKQIITTEAEKLAKAVIHGIQEKKAKSIVSLDLSEIHNAVCKYFIICHGTSDVQVNAIAESAIEQVRVKLGEKPWHTEGYENAEWILIDYVDVVLHIFQKNVRDFYQLEDLWADGKLTKFESDD